MTRNTHLGGCGRLRLQSERLLALCVVAFSMACGGPLFVRTDASVASLLWLPEDTQLEADALRPIRRIEGRGVFVDGSASVLFTSSLACDQFARQISERFPASVWRSRSTQYDAPPSAAPGHLCFNVETASPVGPGGEPFWVQEWEAASGEVVSFYLRSGGSALHGSAVYLPKALAEHVRARRVVRRPG